MLKSNLDFKGEGREKGTKLFPLGYGGKMTLQPTFVGAVREPPLHRLFFCSAIHPFLTRFQPDAKADLFFNLA
jgi:hypothetical protein